MTKTRKDVGKKVEKWCVEGEDEVARTTSWIGSGEVVGETSVGMLSGV